MEFKERLRLFLKGIFMGLADIIPGVSGGTIALITGIYERFITAIESIDPRNIKGVDLDFLFPVGLGVTLAFLTASHVILFLLDNYASLVYAFFFGLILSSSVVVYRRKAVVNHKNIISVLLGLFISYMAVSMEYFNLGHGPGVVFVSGILAICAMILPGISGSFVVLMLGQYEYLLGSLKNLVYQDIVIFISGGIVSLVFFSRAIKWFLDNHKELTLSFMIGLMLGALKLPVDKIVPGQTVLSNIGIVISGAIGLGAVLVLENMK